MGWYGTLRVITEHMRGQCRMRLLRKLCNRNAMTVVAVVVTVCAAVVSVRGKKKENWTTQLLTAEVNNLIKIANKTE